MFGSQATNTGIFFKKSSVENKSVTVHNVQSLATWKLGIGIVFFFSGFFALTELLLV